MLNNESQKTSKCGKKTSATHPAVIHVWLFCSYYILLSSVIYHWVYAGQHEIQIFNWYLLQITFGNKNLNKYHSLFLWYDAKCRWESSHKLLLKSWRKLQKNLKQNSVFSFALFLHVTAQNMTQPIITYCRVLTVIQELYTSLNYIQLIQLVLNIQILIISPGRRWGMPYVDATRGLLGWSYHQTNKPSIFQRHVYS